MQAQVFSPIMPQSLFRASWSPANFDVRQAWTQADLQLINNADLPQKHQGATSSWQSNAPSTVSPAPPKKPHGWQERLTMDTHTLYSHSLFKGAALGQLFACKCVLKPPCPETKQTQMDESQWLISSFVHPVYSQPVFSPEHGLNHSLV